MSERGSVRAWVIAFFVAAVVGLGTLIGIGRLVGANRLPGEAQIRPTATDGRTLYLEANCAACHGPAGEGGRGPSLASGPLASLTLDELAARIANGRRLGLMPKFEGVLTPEQIRAVAEYVIALRGVS